MCGIAGVIDLAIDEQTLERMLKSMRRRGPDGNGRFLTEGCCLLHARLAIIDPLGGAQPMCLSWTDEEYDIMFNHQDKRTEDMCTKSSLDCLVYCEQGGYMYLLFK